MNKPQSHRVRGWEHMRTEADGSGFGQPGEQAAKEQPAVFTAKSGWDTQKLELNSFLDACGERTRHNDHRLQ